MFNSKRYDLNRLLWVMKTTRSWMRKVDCGIRECVYNGIISKDQIDWLNHAGQIKGAADVCLANWIDELEKVINELNEQMKK